MDHLQDEIRIALRRLRRQPGFTLTAILTLALGLGANIAIFSLMHAALLRSLPVDRPDQLYRLGDTNNCWQPVPPPPARDRFDPARAARGNLVPADHFEIVRSLAHGDSHAVLTAMDRLAFQRVLAARRCPEADLVTGRAYDWLKRTM
jgi:hypothetical protein